MAFDRTHECWLFPVTMFGNRRSTQAKWARTVARATAARSWAVATDKIPRRSVLEDSADISINEGCRSFLAKQVLWRVYAPHHERHPEDEDVCIALKSEGMRHLWYTVGLLENSATRFPYREFGWCMTSEAKEMWWLPLFRGLVNWLPELELLSPRISNNLDPEFARMYYPQMYGDDVANLEWAGSICWWSSTLGTTLTQDELGKSYRGDLIAAMLDKGWIRRDGDRYAALI